MSTKNEKRKRAEQLNSATWSDCESAGSNFVSLNCTSVPNQSLYPSPSQEYTMQNTSCIDPGMFNTHASNCEYDCTRDPHATEIQWTSDAIISLFNNLLLARNMIPPYNKLEYGDGWTSWDLWESIRYLAGLAHYESTTVNDIKVKVRSYEEMYITDKNLIKVEDPRLKKLLLAVFGKHRGPLQYKSYSPNNRGALTLDVQTHQHPNSSSMVTRESPYTYWMLKMFQEETQKSFKEINTAIAANARAIAANARAIAANARASAANARASAAALKEINTAVAANAQATAAALKEINTAVAANTKAIAATLKEICIDNRQALKELMRSGGGGSGDDDKKKKKKKKKVMMISDN